MYLKDNMMVTRKKCRLKILFLEFANPIQLILNDAAELNLGTAFL